MLGLQLSETFRINTKSTVWILVVCHLVGDELSLVVQHIFDGDGEILRGEWLLLLLLIRHSVVVVFVFIEPEWTVRLLLELIVVGALCREEYQHEEGDGDRA